MVTVPSRHSLPHRRTIPMFGSLKNGRCSSVEPATNRGGICNGTSVLNDGIIPALSNISDDNRSLWAAQLLTMRQDTTNSESVVLSFEVENQVYDCVELAVFNCPKMNMTASRINIYRDASFRPNKNSTSLGTPIILNYTLSNTSCNYLLKYYISITSNNITSSYFNIQFPPLASDSVNYVFVGEVSFLTEVDDCEQWSPELIEATIYLNNSKRMFI